MSLRAASSPPPKLIIFCIKPQTDRQWDELEKKWPNVANTRMLSVSYTAPLQPRRSKRSLETQHFWEGPASYLNHIHLPALALFAEVETKWKTIPTKTPRRSVQFVLWRLILGKERNLLLDTLHAFTKGVQKKERSHVSISLFPAGLCPAYCQSSPEYLYHYQLTDCVLSQTASQSDFSQPGSCYSSLSFPRAQLHSH